MRLPILPTALAMTLALATVNDAHAIPRSPCFNESQTRLLCRYWLGNVGDFFVNLGDWVLKHLTGQKTDHECMVASFQENPELWKNLEVTRGRQFPTERNQLMIYNTEEGMAPVAKKTLGFCYGHANMRFHLTRMAFFDPRATKEALPPFKEGSHAWIEFYYDKIVKMTDGVPQIIPGFADLRAFSEHPALNPWFKRRSVEIWAERAARLQNLIYRESQRDMSSAYSYQLVRDLQDRLDRGYNPIIMFDENSHKLVSDYKGSLHVVNVVAIHPMKNHRTAIVILDDKKPMPNAYDVLVLNHRGGKDGQHAYAYFDPWRWVDPADHSQGAWDLGMGTVNQIRITKENDGQAMMMALNLAKFCKERPDVCKELGDAAAQPAPKPNLPVAAPPYKKFEYLRDEG